MSEQCSPENCSDITVLTLFRFGALFFHAQLLLEKTLTLFDRRFILYYTKRPLFKTL